MTAYHHPIPATPLPEDTDTVLTATKLEQFLEIENNLRSEFQAKLDSKSAELARCQQELATQRQQLQATIDKQIETIGELSAKATTNHRIEQLNRELTNRSENLQEEVSTLKTRAKALQKDLGEAREQIKVLTQYDPARMKKNLEASKKRLAEQTSANELLQKSLSKTKAENLELQRKVKELEDKVSRLEAAEQVEEQAA
jgi:chromosome segregation ATPase